MPPPRVLFKLQAEIECHANIQKIRKILQRENPTNFYVKISRILGGKQSGKNTTLICCHLIWVISIIVHVCNTFMIRHI
jgi:hypothetical protein